MGGSGQFMGVRRIGAASDSGNIEFATENKLHRINLLGALATTADFIQVPEQVGGIFVNPYGSSAFEFLLPIAAGK